ncbi:aminopeptidase N, partial [Thalassotalea fusca]
GNRELVLNGEHLKLESVAINGHALPAELYLLTEKTLSMSISYDEFDLEIVTEINPVENTALEGLYKSGGAFCTQCEAEGFRRITFYLDRPDIMSVFTTKIIGNKKAYPYLLANGNKIAYGDIDNERHFATWHDPFPKPAYLFALVAGDFDKLTDSYTTSEQKQVALEIFVDKGNLSKAHHAMASLKKSMKWDEEVFGLAYDLDIYMIVAVDFFNMGAMENKGLNIFNSKYVLADDKTATDTDFFNIEAVIAHEYFHNWTGNRVTCRDWFQLSLKEGLTVFRDQQFSADMHSSSVERIKNVRVLRSSQFAEDAGPMAHPIRPEKVMEMNNFYTLTVYEKGAEVIRMIHTILGEENFRKGMDLYFERHDGQAVTCDDFVNAMADASNTDLTMFKQWYSQSGTPKIKVEDTYDTERKRYSVTITQINKPSANQPEKLPLHIPVKVELIESGNSTSHLLELKAESNTWHFDNVNSKPVLALPCNFSAPVRLDIQQTDVELETIILSGKDEFCRWDASNRLFSEHIVKRVNNSNYQLPQSLINVVHTILSSNSDPAFKAEQLLLPSFSEIVDLVENAQPQRVVAAIEYVELAIANACHNELRSLYEQLHQARYEYHGAAVGKRALRNACFSYLVKLDQYQSLIPEQYKASDNMTDTLAALSLGAKFPQVGFDSLMSDFESAWHANNLVMDKWFAIQANYQGDDIFERMSALLVHPLFNFANPNRVHALLSAFSIRNAKHFHCAEGRGYKLIAEQVKKLDKINPQVASRLVTQLIQFGGFDDMTQQAMKAEVQQIAQLPELSKDLKEKLDATLK